MGVIRPESDVFSLELVVLRSISICKQVNNYLSFVHQNSNTNFYCHMNNNMNNNIEDNNTTNNKNFSLDIRRHLYLFTLEYSKEKILDVLQELTVTDNPTLIYCSNGIDATGLISVLLLSAVGVNDTDVIYNYQLSISLLSENFFKNKRQNLSVEPNFRSAISLLSENWAQQIDSFNN